MILHSTTHRARRQHQCAACRKEIRMGETYARLGQPSKSYHLQCVATQPTDSQEGAAMSHKDNFARGYFCAVAVLLREDGDGALARSLFSQGGDPSKADPQDIELFREHGLMAVATQPKE
jgi:hypothetical protein